MYLASSTVEFVAHPPAKRMSVRRIWMVFVAEEAPFLRLCEVQEKPSREACPAAVKAARNHSDMVSADHRAASYADIRAHRRFLCPSVAILVK